MHRFDLIPEEFHSLETGEPFRRCTDCRGPLAEDPNGYLIQKAFNRGEPIMEIAVCHDCHQRLQAEYSQESRERIMNFHLDHGDLPNRLKHLQDQPLDTLAPWVGTCLTCDHSRDDCDEHVIATHCIEDVMIYGEAPIMICGECMERLVEQLSESTRDSYDRWQQRCLPMAPAEPDRGPRVRMPI